LLGVIVGFLVHRLAAAIGLTALFVAVPFAYELLKRGVEPAIAERSAGHPGSILERRVVVTVLFCVVVRRRSNQYHPPVHRAAKHAPLDQRPGRLCRPRYPSPPKLDGFA
jgi:hypothetical protein